MALSALVVKQLKATEKPQKLTDGGGMYLLIQPQVLNCGAWITVLTVSARRWRWVSIQT